MARQRGERHEFAGQDIDEQSLRSGNRRHEELLARLRNQIAEQDGVRDALVEGKLTPHNSIGEVVEEGSEVPLDRGRDAGLLFGCPVGIHHEIGSDFRFEFEKPPRRVVGQNFREEGTHMRRILEIELWSHRRAAQQVERRGAEPRRNRVAVGGECHDFELVGSLGIGVISPRGFVFEIEAELTEEFNHRQNIDEMAVGGFQMLRGKGDHSRITGAEGEIFREIVIEKG